MSDEGEKTCPLCAEEMDLTDQQLKPCKCGYEICVWCWHHIMDMAEKDDTEGRCPACRTPYNKEKIVGTTASCERLVSEMNVEKKLKSQKGKNKTSEGRKQLASVRVIQRNLVYVVGLPLNFADEDLLQRRDYFGQYGKVLKVSISRTAAGAIQQFANSTCSVYITYSKEEEAVRCIQLVHGFVLDGKTLRACFGTTKYCHAWLRNVDLPLLQPCSNPDCLYLHEIGSQEDSFTKDEIISAYTSNGFSLYFHVLMASEGATLPIHQKHSLIAYVSCGAESFGGNVLPPPADEYCNNTSASSGKPITKTAVNTNNTVLSARVSPPNSSSGRSAALPAGASWGTRASNNHSLVTSVQCSSGPLKQKPGVSSGPVACSAAVASPIQLSSLHSDTGKMRVSNEESTTAQSKTKAETLEPWKKESSTDRRIIVSESSAASVQPVTLPINRHSHSQPTTNAPPISTDIIDSSLMLSVHASDKDYIDATEGNVENICSDISSVSIHENQVLQDSNVGQMREPVTSQTSGTAANTTEDVTDVQSDFGLGAPTHVTQVDMHEIDDDLLSFNNQRLKDPEVVSNRIPNFGHEFHLSTHSSVRSHQFNGADNLDGQVPDRTSNLMASKSNLPGGHTESVLKSPLAIDVEHSNPFPSKLLGRYEGDVASGGLDMGESSIISNILSMDFESWDESLTSPQNLAKFLGETDKQQGSFGVPVSRKSQNSSQSRFSFAREEPTSQISDFGQSIDYFDKGFHQRPFSHDFSNSNPLHIEQLVSRNGFPVSNGTESESFASSHSHVSNNKLSRSEGATTRLSIAYTEIPRPDNKIVVSSQCVSRSQISAPPGFSVPSRAAPPGFTSHERTEQILDTVSGNQMLDASSLLRNHYHTPSGGNPISNGDIEFMDPAILAVGKGTLPVAINSAGVDFRSSYSPQLSTYGDARFQSFLQRSLPPHQNQRFTDLGDSFSPLSDAYGIPSRVMEQTLANNLSPFSQFTVPQSRNGITSNGQWDGWNEVQGGNNLGMAELLRTERLGFNKFYSGYEDSKIRMPSSGNIYNGNYGI
ncbi:UNVERIFIED_CONTAM: putative general negative regulator of transcription C16 [Sesamum latifolium]|uniref:General negative regulator of transcription C16 n=1 Tax=Sesamum latifolium TaxID=2727402 RepID=A0AAW2Y4F4_9LAMI